MFTATVEISDEIDLKKVGNRTSLLNSGELAVKDTYMYRRSYLTNRYYMNCYYIISVTQFKLWAIKQSHKVGNMSPNNQTYLCMLNQMLISLQQLAILIEATPLPPLTHTY